MSTQLYVTFGAFGYDLTPTSRYHLPSTWVIRPPNLGLKLEAHRESCTYFLLGGIEANEATKQFRTCFTGIQSSKAFWSSKANCLALHIPLLIQVLLTQQMECRSRSTQRQVLRSQVEMAPLNLGEMLIGNRFQQCWSKFLRSKNYAIYIYRKHFCSGSQM